IISPRLRSLQDLCGKYDPDKQGRGQDMLFDRRTLLGAGIGCAAVMVASLSAAQAANEHPLFITVGNAARPPIGWTDFCVQLPRECDGRPLEARDVVLSQK